MDSISVLLGRYEALVAAALAGDTAKVRDLDRTIRREAGLKQYRLWVRWSSRMGRSVPPPNATNWPAEQRAEIVMTRAIERLDVEDLLNARAVNPVAVHVTSDPDGEIGWYELDAFDFARMQ